MGGTDDALRPGDIARRREGIAHRIDGIFGSAMAMAVIAVLLFCLTDPERTQMLKDNALPWSLAALAVLLAKGVAMALYRRGTKRLERHA